MFLLFHFYSQIVNKYEVFGEVVSGVFFTVKSQPAVHMAVIFVRVEVVITVKSQPAEYVAMTLLLFSLQKYRIPVKSL